MFVGSNFQNINLMLSVREILDIFLWIIYCNKLQQLPDVEEQFRCLGTTKTVSQSQEVKKQDDSKVKGDDDDDDDAISDEEGLYRIMFRGPNSEDYKTRFFDEEGFTILGMTSKKLQVKKRRRSSRKKRG